jgi:hypothetical protein
VKNWNFEGNKRREYLKYSEMETNDRNKNIRDLCKGINEFYSGYQC